MARKLNILLIGESWMVHTVEAKGFDVFSADSYGEGIEYIKHVLSTSEFTFNHMPCHRVSLDFPVDVNGLLIYDAIIISDIGANTFLLPSDTFFGGKRTSNKLQMLKDYVINGGGLMMAGGYLSFMGIEGKGKYHDSIIEEVMPVDFLAHDDRVEHPEGIDIDIDNDSHPILFDIGNKIEGIMGYNKAKPKEGCQVIATVEGNPLIVLGEFGKGRSIAYATDIAPHWSPIEFCQSPTYTKLIQNMVRWLAGEM